MHSLTKSTYHFCFVTKYRKKYSWLNNPNMFYDTIYGSQILEIAFSEGNHVHLLIKLRSVDNIAKIACSLKTSSSFYMKRTAKLASRSTWEGWQAGFFAESVGAGFGALKNYLSHQ